MGSLVGALSLKGLPRFARVVGAPGGYKKLERLFKLFIRVQYDRLGPFVNGPYYAVTIKTLR